MDRTQLIYLVVGALGLSIAVGVFVYYIIKSLRAYKIPYVDGTSKGVLTTTMTTIDSDVITFNGDQGTIIFWLYVHKLPSQALTVPILQIGRAQYLRGDDAARTNQRMNNITVSMNATNLLFTLPCGDGSTCTDLSKLVTLTTPYIASERWTQYAFTINMSSRRIICYIDAEKVEEYTYPSKTNVGFPKATQLVIGSDNGFEGMIGSVGFVAKILDRFDIQAEYNKGPVGAAASKFNLPVYGLRSPIKS